MTRVKLTLEDLTGGSVPILEAFMAHPTVVAAKSMNATIAMTLCRQIIEDKAKAALQELVEGPIQNAYDMYVLSFGEHADTEDQEHRDDWEEGIDNAVETVLTPYERMVSASWFGQQVIDTRLHVPPDEKNLTPPVLVLAQSFAREAWQNLISYTHEDDDGKKELRVKSSAQILSAVGIVKSDIEELLADKLTTDAAVAATEQPTETEFRLMPTLEQVLNKVHAHLGGDLSDVVNITGLLEQAMDDDDGLAVSGMSQLGGGIDDCEPLRTFAMMYDTPATAAEAVFEKLSEVEDVPLGEAPGDEEAELAAMMGAGAVPDAGPMPGFLVRPAETAPAAPAAGTVPPPVQTGAPPKKGRGKNKVPDPVNLPEGTLGPAFFALVREHVKMKDEEMAAGIGVSRQTFINYTKKGAYTPNAEQRAWLQQVISKAMTGLDTAYKML